MVSDPPLLAVVPMLLANGRLPVLLGELLVIVIVSVLADVVMVMPSPDANVRVSVVESATTLLCPATAMVLNELVPPPDMPEPSMVMLCPETAVVTPPAPITFSVLPKPMSITVESSEAMPMLASLMFKKLLSN